MAAFVVGFLFLQGLAWLVAATARTFGPTDVTVRRWEPVVDAVAAALNCAAALYVWMGAR